ncbi:Alpha-hemolysin translocation ATP-binding protein HlyB [Alloiococcus otitis]|uniref:ABC transporter domain-containing protein n=2 Tax=Alloiococcus TaxID=1651 RepID=K9E6X4_9LACT|nr:hypothetical protein HMPREF9698_01596 [Alloiococcus otitis ATCC 51267]SUU80506.1 Alpha-hemolysin translocation ATP-binding protein HlyB [Alloiococcus otitis]
MVSGKLFRWPGLSGLMVFDEPSASLDATHEDHFIQSMSHMSQDQTLLLVTHRFSALKLVDRAVYLEGGQVKEDGCLKDLIKDKKTRVSQIFQLQADKYQID